MPAPGSICIKDYDYNLPGEQIAQFPLDERDSSKLLVYKQNEVIDDHFSNIGQYLPANSLLVFNDTRVIRARLLFTKHSGALIEIFCLEPLKPTADIQSAFHQTGCCTWKCLVGNLKRWKSGTLVLEHVTGNTVNRLFADLNGELGGGCFEIAFHWEPAEKTFSEILEMSGLMPLPPYINRRANLSDNDRYQTTYATHEGSVAAPTAGLHFTAPLISKLHQQGIVTENVTLHVGVGTFRPVAAEQVGDHVMHHEKIIVSGTTIEGLLRNLHRPMFAVGTTSARTVESIYWLGVRLIQKGPDMNDGVPQWYPYGEMTAQDITPRQSLEALLQFIDSRGLSEYSGETRLMVVPGYKYRLLSGLITNFHMPQSTLLLLVAAMIGEEWKNIYNYAVDHGYRFLSYGDSCLFFNQQK